MDPNYGTEMLSFRPPLSMFFARRMIFPQQGALLCVRAWESVLRTDCYGTGRILFLSQLVVCSPRWCENTLLLSDCVFYFLSAFAFVLWFL